MQPLSCALLLFFVIRNREQYFVNFFKYSRKSLSCNERFTLRSSIDSESPNFFDVPSNLPKIRNIQLDF